MDRSGKRWMGIVIVIVALTAGIVMAAGCSVEQSSRTKVRDLEYEIVAEAEVPEELLAICRELGITEDKVNIILRTTEEGTDEKTGV